MSADALFERAKAHLAMDASQLVFDDGWVTGKRGLVSANLVTGKVTIRRNASGRPFRYLNLPTRVGGGSEALSKALMHPKLKGALDLDMMDDLTAVLWAYVNIRLLDAPVALKAIKIDPTVSEMFSPHEEN